jgi:hypothetical protein
MMQPRAMMFRSNAQTHCQRRAPANHHGRAAPRHPHRLEVAEADLHRHRPLLRRAQRTQSRDERPRRHLHVLGCLILETTAVRSSLQFRFNFYAEDACDE